MSLKLVGEICINTWNLQSLGRSWDRIPLSPRVVGEANQALRSGKSCVRCLGCWFHLKIERADWLMTWYVFKL
jgi:hypothetical protein